MSRNTPCPTTASSLPPDTACSSSPARLEGRRLDGSTLAISLQPCRALAANETGTVSCRPHLLLVESCQISPRGLDSSLASCCAASVLCRHVLKLDLALFPPHGSLLQASELLPIVLFFLTSFFLPICLSLVCRQPCCAVSPPQSFYRNSTSDRQASISLSTRL